MAITIRYDARAALSGIDKTRLEELNDALLVARQQVLQDVELLNSAKSIPKSKQPLDAGFLELPKRLLAAAKAGPESSLVGRIQRAAHELSSEVDRLVLLGIGGSYMGARALFEALCHPYHNEQNRDQRDGIPRLYFEGNNLDNDSVAGLLELLNQSGDDSQPPHRWGIIVISKSGGTLETAVAFRLFRSALEKFYGADSPESRRYVIPVTGDQGKLHDLSIAVGYPTVFPIPDNVGGRFSIFTAVGLLPAAALGLNINRLLEGAADMTDCFQDAGIEENPVLEYTRTCRVLERDFGMKTRVLSTWGNRLEAVGFWYDQLLSESLGKQELGPTPITVVNTRDLHSRGQQHQDGTRDKLITNLIVENTASTPLALENSVHDHDQLNRHQGKTIPSLLSAAIAGTNQAYSDANRPTADIFLTQLDEYNLGQLLQMFMLATVVEGRLIGINPYGQPGVEAYKTNMTNILNG